LTGLSSAMAPSFSLAISSFTLCMVQGPGRD
jgi:hypothetical protein